MVLNETYRKLIINTVSLLFIILFVYAAISKLLDFETFRLQLAQSPLLSAYAGVIAWVVPGVELLVSLFLMVPRYRALGFYASFTLMVMFTAYIYIILNFSDFVPCSCGGVLEDLSWTQHLVFNVVFIILAGTAVFFTAGRNTKRTLLMLASLSIFGVGTITLLFAFSEKKMHRNNAFLRRYIPHSTSVQEVYDLKYNSWYIAGINSGKVYLGNVTAPLKLMVLDTLLRKADTVTIGFENLDLPYRSITVSVGKESFYAMDGTVPVIISGKKVDWKGYFLKTARNFTAATVMDSQRIAVRSINARSLKNSISIFSKDDSMFKKEFILPARGDGIFESDGQLLWNAELDKLVYVYFYSNKYFLMDPTFENTLEQHTIDTVVNPALEILHFKKEGQDKLRKNISIINIYAATNGEFLFIKSNRLGRIEPKEMLEEASIIDIYNIKKNEYLYSFYLYDLNGKKLSSFWVDGYTFYAILDNELVKYRITPIHNNSI